ncbi:hypothetical protein D3C76_709610 [compost metagenome]
MQLHRLADAHVLELGFLEVGVDPHLVQRDHRHQRRARLHALADLHGALGDVACHRRDQHRAGVVEVGLAQLGRGRLHIGVGHDVGVVDQGAGGVEPLLGGGQGVACGVEGVAGVGQFLLGDGAIVGEVLAALVVGFGLGQGDLLRRHVRLVAFDVAEQPAHLAHAARQVGLGLLQGDVGVARIEAHQHLALVHQVAVVGADAHHGAGDLRSDLHHVAVHVGVLGVLVPAADEVFPARARGAGDQHDGEQDQQPALALRHAVGDFLLVGGHVDCLVQCAPVALAWATAAASGSKPPPRARISCTERSIRRASSSASWRSARSSCCCTLRASR